MALQPDVKKHLEHSTDESLLNMLDKPSDFLPEAIEYAGEVLRQRGHSEVVGQKLAVRRQADEVERQRTDEDLQRIDDAARLNLSNVFLYRLAVTSLQRHSSGIMLSAFYNVAVGLHGVFRYSRLNWLLVALGIGCLIVGIRCARRPVPRRLLESGIMFIFAAIWNLILAAGGNQENLFFWIGMLQGFWGSENISLFFRTWRIPKAEPSSADLALIDQVLTIVRKTDFKQPHAFMIGDWKALLAHTGAVFMTGKGSDEKMLFACRDQLKLLKAKKHFLGDQFAITLRVHRQKIKGLVSGEVHRRLEKWIIK